MNKIGSCWKFSWKQRIKAKDDVKVTWSGHYTNFIKIDRKYLK